MRRVEVAQGIYVNESGTGIVDRLVHSGTPFAENPDFITTVGGVRLPMPPAYVEPADRTPIIDPTPNTAPAQLDVDARHRLWVKAEGWKHSGQVAVQNATGEQVQN